jgi:hypothetical protein
MSARILVAAIAAVTPLLLGTDSPSSEPRTEL